MMNNKSPFYYSEGQLYKVMGYLELFLNLNYVESSQDEWVLVEEALKTISMLPEDRRNADSFYEFLDNSVSFKKVFSELTSSGKYALFEDNREIILKEMDDVMFSLFDYYGNFMDQ